MILIENSCILISKKVFDFAQTDCHPECPDSSGKGALPNTDLRANFYL
jgi:hypothetical protein